MLVPAPPRPRAKPPLAMAVVVTLLVAWSVPASAGELTDRARAATLYKEGVQHFAAGRYAEALGPFLASRAIYPYDGQLSFIAECHRRLRQFRLAHQRYGEFAAAIERGRGPGWQDKLSRLRKQLEALRLGQRCPVSVTTTPARARVSIDGRAVGSTPEAVPLRLDATPGTSALRVELAGHRPATRQLACEFGEPLSVTLALESLPPPPVVARSPAQPTRVRVAAVVGRRADSRAPRSAGGGLFVDFLVGPVFTDYGDTTLNVGNAIEVGLDAGYLWRGRRLGIHVFGSALYTPVSDGSSSERQGFVGLLAGVGGRLYLRPRLWLDVRFAAGVSILFGASEKSFFFADAREASGAFATVALRPAVGVGWTIWRGLTVSIFPFALDYSPRYAGYDARITRVVRYHPTLGLGWQASDTR